tara:strand:+ start:7582 stop:7971 length:390 start_codon:yes stop_codon:yes gene_type:complete
MGEDRAAEDAVPQPEGGVADVAPAAPSAAAPLETLRAEMRGLVASDAVDKPTALELVRLWNAAETLLLQEQHARAYDVAALRHELERTRLQAELDRYARRHTLDEAQLRQLADERKPSSASVTGFTRRS